MAVSDKSKSSFAFEIKISRRVGPASYAANIESPAGRTTIIFGAPLDKPVIEATLADFRANLKDTRNLPSSQTYTPPTAGVLTPEELGVSLFDHVFQPKVIDLYRASQQQAKREGRSLPVIVNVDPNAGDLINLPWEFLYDTSAQRVRGEFLAFNQNTPIIRRWLRTEPVDFSYDLPLRVLLVSANPQGSEPLNVQKEHSQIKEKLTALNHGNQTKVRLDYLSAATLSQLKQVIRNQHQTPHIIHFMGHGGLGSLLIEDKEGGEKTVSEQSLAIILKNAPSLRLVVLNACETAQSDWLAKQLGVAQALADAGVPAIVAMQFLISDQAALVFAEEFYQLLAEGHSIDSAVTWGRIAIRTEFENSATKEWGTPVLYLQAPDGHILTDLLGEQTKAQPKPPVQDRPAGDQAQFADQAEPEAASKTEQMRREEAEKAAQIEHLQNLLKTHYRRLQERQLQAARYGIDVPPHITLEIADIRTEIKEIEQELNALEPEIVLEEVTPPSTVTRPVNVREVGPDRAADSKEFGVDSQANKFYTQGQTALDKQEWNQALSYLSRAQKLAPGLPDIDNLVTQARQNWLQTPEGQNYHYTLDALYDQAQQHLNQGNLEAATALLEQIVRDDAGYKDAYDQALETRARADKEKAEREKQAKLQQLYDRAQACLAEEDWTAAIELLTGIIELDDGYKDAQHWLNEATRQRNLEAAYREGEQHFKKREWAKAVAAFGKVSSIDEHYRDVPSLLKKSRRERQLDAWTQEAEDYFDEEAWEAAIEVLEENQVVNFRQEAHLPLAYAKARRHLERGEWTEAVEQFKSIVEARPTYRPDLDTLYQQATDELYLQQQFDKAVAHIGQGEWLAAKTSLENIIKVRADYPKAQERLDRVENEIKQANLYKKAIDAIKLKQWAKAISYLKEIPAYRDASDLLKTAQKQVELAAFYQQGLEAANNGHWLEAVDAFGQVIALEPGFREVKQQLHNAKNKIMLQESFKLGIEALEAGRQTFDPGRLAEAVTYLETAAEIDPRFRGVENRLREAKRQQDLLENYLAGEAAYQAGQWSKAVEHWQFIVKDEKEPAYHDDSAQRLAEAERQKTLAELYDQAVAYYEAKAWDNAVVLLEQLQQETLDEPYQDTGKRLAEAKTQQTLQHHYDQAQQFITAERWEQAIEPLQQIQQIHPAYRQVEISRMLNKAQTNYDATRHYNAGLAALQAENWAEAASYFDRVYKLKADFRDVETRLSQAQRQQRLAENYQAALEAIAAEAWTDAIDYLVQIQGLDPDYKEAPQKLAEAERQHQLALDYQTALAHYKAERWTDAYEAFADILDRQNNYKEAETLRNRAHLQLDMADKYERAREKRVLAAAQPEHWQSVVELLSAVAAGQADYRDTPVLLDEAKTQARLHTLYQQATVLGAKDTIPDLEQAIELLAQIIEADLNYREAVPLKAGYEKKVAARQKEQQRMKIDALSELAIESAGQGRLAQVVEYLQQITNLDKAYQARQAEIVELIRQHQAKKRRGNELMAQEKFDEAITVFEACEQEELELPRRIQAILKQN